MAHQHRTYYTMRTFLSSLVLFLTLLPVSSVSANIFSTGREGFALPISPNVTTTEGIQSCNSRNSIDQEVPYFYETPNNGTVKLTAQNNTGVPVTGDIIRESPLSGEIITEFTVPAGETFVFIDDDVLPGTTYLYVFEYFIQGNPIPVINLDHITPVATMPALGSFNLIAASTDDAYDVLRNGKTIAIDNTNIQAEANEEHTGSVVFYLNDKRYHDNTYPFSLFGDVSGDYKAGRLKNGSYTLIAIAYPGKNGKGLAGDTARVNFAVEIQYEDPQVSVYPNPVKEHSTVSVKGIANSSVSIEAYAYKQSAATKQILYDGFLDHNGFLKYAISSQEIGKGLYILSIRINGKVIQKRLVVE